MNNDNSKKSIPFLSFIVPVYNVEKYLCDCLNSLLSQGISPEEYEIICVNDGSTDKSLDILKEYEKANINVRVINEENGGVCVARNTGLAEAKGTYVWFIDSDDLVHCNVLGTLKTELEKQNCDRLLISHFQFSDPTPSISITIEKQNLPINTAWKESVVWRSIFKKSFLIDNKLMFHPGLVFGEDALFMFECFYNEPVVAVLDLPVYYHRSVVGSASTNTSAEFMKKRNHSTLREAQIMQTYYEKENHKFPQETANRLMIFLWGILGAVAHMSKSEAKPYLSELKKSGLFPYHRPDDCTITRSYQTTREDVVGKLFDKIYTSSHTRIGFMLLRLWYIISDLKN